MKHIQSIKHNFLYILHICINMYITSIFLYCLSKLYIIHQYLLFIYFKLSEVSHIRHVLTLKKIIDLGTINKFEDIQYMNAFIKDV